MTRKLSGDRCRCNACGEYFNTTGVFDRHRQGPYTARRCMSVAEMEAKGYSVSGRGFWIRRKRVVDTGTPAVGPAINAQGCSGGLGASL